LPKDAYILELFCGRGECQQLLKDNEYANVFGGDISLTLLNEARGDCSVQACNSLKLCYKSDTFDALFINDGLHHLSDMAQIEQLLLEVKRVLKNGGLFTFFEPADTVFRTLATMLVFSPFSKLSKRTKLLRNILESEKKELTFWLKNSRQVIRLLGETGFREERYYNTFIHMVLKVRK